MKNSTFREEDEVALAAFYTFALTTEAEAETLRQHSVRLPALLGDAEAATFSTIEQYLLAWLATGEGFLWCESGWNSGGWQRLIAIENVVRKLEASHPRLAARRSAVTVEMIPAGETINRQSYIALMNNNGSNQR